MSLKKCATRPWTRLIFHDIVCDTNRRRFGASETVLEKLETLLKEVLQNHFIAFHGLKNWRENIPA